MTNYLPTTEDAPVQVVLEVPDHEQLAALLTSLSETDLSVQTEQIAPAHVTDDCSVTIDIGVLTDKQREALELAVRSGYYERPREASLVDLAETLDITKSAVSQRLNAAETKLVRNALERYR